MININRLDNELRVFPIEGICLGWEGPQDEPRCTYHAKDGIIVRVVWLSPATPAQRQQADQIVQTHDGNPTPAEKMDALPMKLRVMAALAFRASASWSQATTVQRAEAQQILDAAGAKVAQVIPR